VHEKAGCCSLDQSFTRAAAKKNGCRKLVPVLSLDSYQSTGYRRRSKEGLERLIAHMLSGGIFAHLAVIECAMRWV